MNAKNYLFLCLFFLLSCTSKKQNSIEPKEVSITPQAIRTCQAYQRNVLKAVVSLEKENKVEISPNPELVRRALKEFDPEVSLSIERGKLIRNILVSCDAQKLTEFDTKMRYLGECNIVFDELQFFQGLAQGYSKYPWPTDLKLEGKNTALDYVRFYSEEDFTLLNRLIALSVLDELSVTQIVNEDLHAEIKSLLQESEIFVQGLRRSITKESVISCENLGVLKEEMSYSEKIGVKMKSLLSRL